MTTLSDITLYGILPTDYTYLTEWQKVLMKYKVYDCQTLYDYVSSGNQDFQQKRFLQILNLSVSITERAENDKTHRISIPTDEPQRRAIERTDIQIYGDMLPLFSPMSSEGTIKKRIHKYNIATIKYLLGKITTDGTNGINLIAGWRGTLSSSKIANAVEFYNDQLLRTAKTVPNLSEYDGNLFLENRSEKERIVMEHIRDIIDYLISNGSNFAWGEMGENAKTQLDNSVVSSDPDERIYSIRLAQMIRDYTTLEELEGDFIEDGTLNRFILKPRQPKK